MPMELSFAVERRALHPGHFRDTRHVGLRLLDEVKEILSLKDRSCLLHRHLRQRGHVEVPGQTGGRCHVELFGQVPYIDNNLILARIQVHGFLHDVLQLTYVARPGMLLQRLDSFRRKRRERQAPLFRPLSGNAFDKYRDIRHPFGERRNSELDHRESVVEVAGKVPTSNPVRQIAVRRRGDAHVDPVSSRRVHRAQARRKQVAESGLQTLWKLFHFIDEQCSPMCTAQHLQRRPVFAVHSASLI